MFKNIKEKVNLKIVFLVVIAFFVIAIISLVETNKEYAREKQLIQNEYNKSMYETVGYIKNVESDLAKLQITTTKSLQITTLADIWKQSNLAKENFESLPLEQASLDNTSKYLTQLSDYSYFLLKELTLGHEITDENFENISNLYVESKNISLVMSNIYNDLNSGNIQWDELQEKGNEELKTAEISDTVSSFAQIGKTFQEYEGLIYDGAFSDHILTAEPKYLGENECSEEDAKKYITKIFKEENVEYITSKGESNGKIDLYNFEVKLKNSDMVRLISITKKDCKMYSMIADRVVKSENIVMQSAIDKGIEFLKQIGIENVEETYYLKTDNMVIINYAAMQSDIMLYPDLVKVKVALDNGEVCSVEAQGYIFNHRERKDITPTITEEEARKVVSSRVKIIGASLTIISTESQSEVLCYEYKGKIEDREVLIYVNAKTGLEEQVLLILETPGGTLTM